MSETLEIGIGVAAVAIVAGLFFFGPSTAAAAAVAPATYASPFAVTPGGTPGAGIALPPPAVVTGPSSEARSGMGHF